MTDKKTYSVVFAGGGTGGHIYPGIAVADALQSLSAGAGYTVKIYWIGNKSGMDKDIIGKNLVSEGGSVTGFFGIPCGKLRRYLSFRNLVDMFKIVGGFFASLFILLKLKPDCLFSKGGFVSVPPCWAAKVLSIPYYTHECDVTPGLATRLNAGGAKNILVSYSATAGHFSSKKMQDKCVMTGNPVRPVFYTDDSASGRNFLGIGDDCKKPVLLVLGGSLGALQINNLVTENLDWLTDRFIVVHQTGKAFAESHGELMNSSSDSYKPYAFIYKEMPAVIQAADIVLSRAGANSLWECITCAKPMVLVPLCGSGTRGDQVDNAAFFEKKGAAAVLLGDNATGGHMKEMLERLLNIEERQKMSAACRQFSAGEPPATTIAKIIMDGMKR